MSAFTQPTAAQSRLAGHKAILEAHGITNLAALGTLSLSGTIVPQPGLVRAPFVASPRQAKTFRTAAASVRSATRVVAPQAKGGMPTALRVSGAATKLIGEPPVGAHDDSIHVIAHALMASSASLPINTAYWVGSTIQLVPGTTIVIQPDIRFLVIIANEIKFEANVALTYDEIPLASAPGVPPKPPAPGQPSTPSNFSQGSAGLEGTAGTQPAQVGAPPAAPEVEVWTLDLTGMPTVHLKGQHGYTGVRGGDGGDGGTGGNGSESSTSLTCKNGPGKGGDGGKGGPGGPGGIGGVGGRWSLYAPAPQLAAVASAGFFIEAGGGNGGDGGPPGSPGNGGSGGSHGGTHGGCTLVNFSDRPDGNDGPNGDAGGVGPAGAQGLAAGPDAMKFVPIDPSDFWSKLDDPAIVQVTPSTATVGSTITLTGFRFAATDVARVNGAQTAITYIAPLPPTAVGDSLIRINVPNTTGGLSEVQISRSDGSRPSNKGTLFIPPVILGTVPSPRLRPGSTVQINGSGFSPADRVRINSEDIGPVTFIDSQTIKFVMKRPAIIPHFEWNSGGEPGLLSVAGSAPVLVSNSVQIEIATYQMLVIGDSVAYGEGLSVQDKYHTLVAAQVTAANGAIGVYETVTACTGAILGWNDIGSGPTMDGDIPSSYPTVRKQAEALAAKPNAAQVDLILISAGANDVESNTYLSPHVSRGRIDARVSQYCDEDMTALLTWLLTAFPVAKCIVTGYYAALSPQSDHSSLVDFVGIMYGLSANKGHLPRQLAQLVYGVVPGSASVIDGNAAYFAAQANAALAKAVTQANATVTAPRVFFADPQFKPQNAAFAPDPWVFGMSDIGGVLEPVDSVASVTRRKNVCHAAYGALSKNRIYCDLASTGHPNIAGAQHYAAAIIPFL